MARLEKLEIVVLTGNPLHTMPTMFHSEPWEKIRRYVLSLSDKKREWKERKVHLLPLYESAD